jgi:hypothetical protein
MEFKHESWRLDQVIQDYKIGDLISLSVAISYFNQIKQDPNLITLQTHFNKTHALSWFNKVKIELQLMVDEYAKKSFLFHEKLQLLDHFLFEIKVKLGSLDNKFILVLYQDLERFFNDLSRSDNVEVFKNKLDLFAKRIGLESDQFPDDFQVIWKDLLFELLNFFVLKHTQKVDLNTKKIDLNVDVQRVEDIKHIHDLKLPQSFPNSIIMSDPDELKRLIIESFDPEFINLIDGDFEIEEPLKKSEIVSDPIKEITYESLKSNWEEIKTVLTKDVLIDEDGSGVYLNPEAKFALKREIILKIENILEVGFDSSFDEKLLVFHTTLKSFKGKLPGKISNDLLDFSNDLVHYFHEKHNQETIKFAEFISDIGEEMPQFLKNYRSKIFRVLSCMETFFKDHGFHGDFISFAKGLLYLTDILILKPNNLEEALLKRLANKLESIKLNYEKINQTGLIYLSQHEEIDEVYQFLFKYIEYLIAKKQKSAKNQT